MTRPNKLCVATRTSGITRKHNKILQCLSTYPEGATPKTIALYTSINVNTVKSILPKLEGVKKIMRGLYKVVGRGDGALISGGDELTSWNFHNVVLSTVLKDFGGKSISSSYSLGLVNCEFTIGKSGSATLRIACDTPLNVASIGMVFGFFSELVARWSEDVVSADKVFLKTIEFNKDFSNLRLDGLRCVSVESLCSQFKVYQKRLGLRVEHKTKVPLSVENLVDMLRSNPASLDYNIKLSALKKQLDRQVVATEKNTEILFKLIEKLKGDDVE